MNDRPRQIRLGRSLPPEAQPHALTGYCSLLLIPPQNFAYFAAGGITRGGYLFISLYGGKQLGGDCALRLRAGAA
jgi:hypothetical protein